MNAKLVILVNAAMVINLAVNQTSFGQPQAIQGIDIPEEIAPIITSIATVDPQNTIDFVQRLPAGRGLVPIIVYVHGGHRYRSLENRTNASLNHPTITRLLNAGFGIVLPSFRSYEQFEANQVGPIDDVAAVLETLRSSPRVDPNSIIMMGHSSGGRMTLEIAARPDPPKVIIVSEPASTLLAELFPMPDPNVSREPFTPNLGIVANLEKYYTRDKQDIVEDKVQRISSPVMLIHSDIHQVNRANARILIPALTKYKKLTKEINYPGYGHGYINGSGGITEDILEMFIDDVVTFSSRYISTQPQPLSY